MAKKIKYSLTAKERKELREKEKIKLSKAGKVPVQPSETSESSDATAVINGNKHLWVMITAIICGLVLILLAIILPVSCRATSRYPMVTLTLSNGKTVDIEIWEEDCPIGATNFLFLLKAGYFESGLIHDVQDVGAVDNEYADIKEGFLRFGVFTNDYQTRRIKDTAFTANVKYFNLDVVGDTYKDNASANKFGYRLYADGTDGNRAGEPGVISYISDDSQQMVINMFAAKRDATSSYSSSNGSGGRDDFGSKLRSFGKVADDESLDALRELLGINTVANNGTDYFMGTDPAITIRSYKIRNENKKKWRKFEFVSYMLTANNGSSAFSGWRAS